MAAYLLDTNVVLRLIDRNDPDHTLCQQAVERLIQQQHEPCLAPQVLVEFWVVATRPMENNGFGWSPVETNRHLDDLCRLFRLLPEPRALFDRWRQMVVARKVHGKRAHDARLAAFMVLHGIANVLTLNPRDFNGFGVTVVEPAQLANEGAP